MRIGATESITSNKAGILKKSAQQNLHFSAFNITVQGASRQLCLAALLGNESPVLQLLQDGADIEWKSGNEENKISETFLYKGLAPEAEIDPCAGKTPLHLAAESGHFAMVEVLLDRGAYTDARDLNETTALHLAAAK